MEDIFDDLPIDFTDALEVICLRFEETDEELDGKVEYYDEYITALGAFEALTSAKGINTELDLGIKLFDLDGDRAGDISYIRKLFDEAYMWCLQARAQTKLEKLRNKFLGVLGEEFTCHFSDDEVSRLQVLINELREHIRKFKKIESGHKDRLLRRLEKLQSEVHKQVSDLDRFWGMVGDAGVVAKKLGEDAKPIVDRIREVANILWKAQAKAESLPSDASNPVLIDESDS